ncbi:Transposase for transposon Tn5 [Budvicia aquatica]|uniref:Transposase for transposon Tn5 n=1 Tax=Budvicia aquatica TaxID=82979 RepID=A0A484ZYN5_9GAMM|nr:Transposase for transposon Tn5 [Budvicia aquatica]
MLLSDCYSWAKQVFGLAKLGDPRRTRRLVTLATSLAQHTGLSIVKSSQSTAEVEGAYRLIRNPSVLPEAIAEAGFIATAEEATRHPVLLALEDTTTISFSHRTASDTLGHTAPGRHTRGLLVHSVLLYAPDKAQMVGLIEQQRWSRDIVTYGKKHQRKKRPYEEKESYKWQKASEQMASRLGIPSHELSPSAIGRRISGSISITKSGRGSASLSGRRTIAALKKAVCSTYRQRYLRQEATR